MWPQDLINLPYSSEPVSTETTQTLKEVKMIPEHKHHVDNGWIYRMVGCTDDLNGHNLDGCHGEGVGDVMKRSG